MPIAPEGHTYTRHMFKPVENSETGGCHADVYLPHTFGDSPCPTALVCHGGGFVTGDTFMMFTGHTRYLLDRGVCVVSVEYRMAPHVRLQGQREDWVDAYRWVKEKLGQVTDYRASGDRVFTIGGSAGGTAVLFQAMDAISAGLPPPQAIYCVYPAVDFDTVWPHWKSVDYETIFDIIQTLPEHERQLVKDMINGPTVTAYDCLREEKTRPLTGRRVWYDLVPKYQYLFPCILEHPGPPYPESTSWLRHVTSEFPPTVFVKAMDDRTLDPEQTTLAYEKLRSLEVDTIQIEAKDMQHGDAEGENDMKRHPPREAYFWKEVYPVAMDWCIERTRAKSIPGMDLEKPVKSTAVEVDVTA